MNLFGWIGVFFLLGGVLFAGAAWSLRFGKRIAAVEAEVIAVHDPEEEDGKDTDAESEEIGTVEYAFLWEKGKERCTVRGVTGRSPGEKERMYYDTVSGALYHPRTSGSMGIAAAAFAAAGTALILLQNTLFV